MPYAFIPAPRLTAPSAEVVQAAPARSPGPALPAEPADQLGPLSLDFAGWDSGTAPSVVASVMDSTSALARSAQGNALATILAMSGYASAFTPLSGLPIPAADPVTLPPLGTAPPPPDLTADFASAPEAPLLATLPALEIGAAPDYDVAAIAILDIALPDPLAAVLPAPPELAALASPLEPDFMLPAVPTLEELALPDAPTLDLPTFVATLDEQPDAPNIEFSYAETEYASSLLTALQDRLLAQLLDEAARGIDPAVEAAIWERAFDREAMLTHRATGEAVRLMRCRGFRMPEQTLVRVVQQALQGGLQRSAGLQRAIAIEQAHLQQANFRFAFETAVSFESSMIDRHNAAQARALEAAKAMVQGQIAVFNARVALFSAGVQAFAVRAAVFKARLDAALAAIEVYRSQLEAQKVVGQINGQRVAVYKAQIAGVRAIVDTYRTRVDAAKAQIANNKAVVEAYRATISAVESQVAAKIAEYDTFAAQVKGQAVKAQLFGKQVDAYRVRVGAFGELARARLGAQQLQFKQANEFPLELYKSQVDAYKGAAGAAIEQLRATVAVMQARVSAFAAQEGAKVGHVQAQLKVAAANIEATLGEAQALVDVGRANLQVAASAAQTAQGNIRSVGQLAGQMAAAAVAAQSVHAAISETAASNTSYSFSRAAHQTSSQTATTSTGSSSTTSTDYGSHTSTTMSYTAHNNTGISYRDSTSSSTAFHNEVHNSTRTADSTSDTTSTSNDTSSSTAVETDIITTHNRAND